MNKNEMMARIAELENRRFYLAMKDRWTSADYVNDANMANEIRTLRDEVAAM